MIKISRLDAFSEIIKATENNETNKANQMMAIVAKSIENDKKNNTFSEYIELRTKKEKNLFKDIIKHI